MRMDVDSGMMSTDDFLPEDLVFASRREEVVRRRSESVHEIVPVQEYKDAGQKLLDLIFGRHRQVC